MNTRTIRTDFHDLNGNVIRTNRSTDSNRAVALALLHLQVAHYRDKSRRPARAFEVWDESSGVLHAVAVRSPANGSITITYKRDPKKYETRLALGALLATK